jgi:DNA-binding SARP family transcriptional activator/tetratricopeptide (TPR) repeat protein/TolB-like protein
MVSRRYFRLRSLGQLSLASVVGETETPAVVRPRHLAVLTVLALARRPVSRDGLVEMFWGGETESRARHSLSNALSGLRALLGGDAITARQDQVSLAGDAMLEVDVAQFIAACETHDDARAVALYGGPFLASVYVADAPEFDAWTARERGRLERSFLEACERRLPGLLTAGEWSAAASLAERWLDASPRSTTAFAALLGAHAGAGTRVALASALGAYDRVARSLFETYGVRPDSAVVALADRMRADLARKEREMPLVASAHGLDDERRLAESPPPPAPQTASVTTTSLGTPRRSSISRWRILLGVAVSVAAVAAVWGWHRASASARPSNHPIVAVTTIDNVGGDSSITWLRAGLPRTIATDLDGLGAVEVVAPVRVREVLVRLAGSPTPRITQEQSADVARRLGASWVVTGGVSTAPKGGYLLDVTLRSLADPSAHAETFVVESDNPLALGSQAAAKLASLLNVGSSGGAPRYSGIETSSPEAYRHYIRGMIAVDAERYLDSARELDAAIALDSGFVVAIRARQGVASELGDGALSRRLGAVARRYASRLPEFDQLADQVRDLDSLAESARADALSQQLIARFPHDPRSYSMRADLLANRGQWAAADSVLLRELALDSLAIAAGDGPCTPCDVYRRLSQFHLEQGDRAAAESAARRWVALQPDLPATWRNLSATLAAVGLGAEAEEAGFHYVALTHETPAVVDFGRTMIAARHPEIADSLVRTWRGSTDPVLVNGVRDLQSILQRERGQFVAAAQTLAALPPGNGLIFVRADCLARTGRLTEARAIYESTGHPPGSARTGQFNPSEARGYSWSHALEADALMRAGDTARARPFIDSLVNSGRQSYYGRDRVLANHVRGMLLFAEGDVSGAERALRAGEWAAGGWTRTNVELARVQLAANEPSAAIATLRDAYTAPVDAMGRYVTRSELDWWMSRAFAAADRADSARVYADYVRAAWKNAEPMTRARLDSLPR